MISGLEAAFNSWQGQASVPIDLRGVTTGGALALLYEAQAIAQSLSIPYVEVRYGEEFGWLKSKLNSTFIETHKESPMVYPSAVKSFSSFAAHSTLRYLSQRGLNMSNLSNDIWDSSTRECVDQYIAENSSYSPLLLSFRFRQQIPSRGDFASGSWRSIFERLRKSHRLLVLGTQVPRGEFEREAVSFAEDSLDLAQQIALMSRSDFPLIGEANGLFSARIWSEIHYLCFKNKDYDQPEMLEEHDGHYRLRVGQNKQLFIRDVPSYSWIEQYLREVADGPR
jgi:hypothetical protein